MEASLFEKLAPSTAESSPALRGKNIALDVCLQEARRHEVRFFRTLDTSFLLHMLPVDWASGPPTTQRCAAHDTYVYGFRHGPVVPRVLRRGTCFELC